MRKHFITNSFLAITAKLLIISLVVLFAASCKKDKTNNPVMPEQKTKVLSAIYIDNIISEKYFYNADKKILKIEDYHPDGTLYKTDHYEYDAAGVLAVVSGLLPDGSLKIKTTYTKNVMGQIISSDFINVGVASYKNTYEYAPGTNKQAIKTSLFDAAGNEFYATVNEYTASLLKEQNYYAISPAGIADLSVKNKYIANTDETLVSRYKNLMTSFTEPLPDSWIIYQVLDTTKSYNYNSGITTAEKIQLVSGRQLDTKGSVKSIMITTKFVSPALPDKSINVRYEYTEL
jgi:hypothetical protein